MKVVGIVAEYNPFHKGHKYQMNKLREETGADYIVIAMSGNFLQRGVPALCDKFSRTSMALKCGADLVLEIPTLWATASAEYFAKGGVSLLSATGVVTHLGFGAETDDLEGLQQIAAVLKEEPENYQNNLSNAILNGNSFPVARKQALSSTLPWISADKLNTLIDSPNNILAMEYLKALPEEITPVLIPRKGGGYHDTDISVSLPSASAIRDAVFSAGLEYSPKAVSNAMPEEAYSVLEKLLNQNLILDTDDFSESLGYCLLSLSQQGFSNYADCTEDLSNKIRNHIKNYVSFSDFTQMLKSKDITYTRVSRCLLHILLNIRQDDYNFGKDNRFAPYLRVLGFKKDSSSLLSAIKKETNIPLISKAADAASILDSEAYKIFEKDIFASNLYYQRLAGKTHTKPMNEFTNQIVII